MQAQIEGNTINDDINKMRIRSVDAKDNSSVARDLVNAVNALLGKENIKQKSRKTMAQVWCSTEIRAVNESSIENFGLCNRVTQFFNDEIEEELISLNGLGRIEAIEMVKSLEERSIEDNKLKVATKAISLK
jgi:hypothetical protein